LNEDLKIHESLEADEKIQLDSPIEEIETKSPIIRNIIKYAIL
jgi:hypothetical protein